MAARIERFERGLLPNVSLKGDPEETAAFRTLEERMKLFGVNVGLESWKVPESRFTSRERITLRRMLNHSAGLAAAPSDGYPAAERLPRLTDVLSGLQPAPSGPLRIDSAPGSRFEYSSVGYALVQQLVEDATGRTFADVPKELVLAKLGMRNSAFSQPLRADRAPSSASGHKPDGAPSPGRWRNHVELAAAGLWTHPPIWRGSPWRSGAR